MNAFTYDDVPLVQDNVRLHDLGNWFELLRAPYWPAPWSQELYRPVMSLLLALQYAIGSGGPMLFRVVSIGLYAACAVLVLQFARRLMPEKFAIASALLFAVHPVHVEAVAEAVNQGELIVAIITLAALILFVDRRRAGTLDARTWGVLAAMTAVAALTKEHGFVLPAIIFVADVCIDRDQPQRGPVKSRLYGYALLGVTCVALLGVRAMVLSGDVVGTYTAEALVGVSRVQRFFTTLQIVPQWTRLLLWPAHLQMDYSPDELVASTSFGAQEALGLLVVVVATVIGFLARRRAPVVPMGLAAAALALLPVSNLIVASSILLAERTLFLASAFVLVALVGALSTARWPSRERQLEFEKLAGGVLAVLLIVGAYRSAMRQTIWRNPVRLWHAASLEAPKSRRVQQARRDAVAALLADYAPRVAAAPDPWRVHRELASLLHTMGDDSAAIDQFRLVVQTHPDRRAATLDLATLYLSFGRPHDAAALARAQITAGDTTVQWRDMARAADSAMRASGPTPNAGSVR